MDLVLWKDCGIRRHSSCEENCKSSLVMCIFLKEKNNATLLLSLRVQIIKNELEISGSILSCASRSSFRVTRYYSRRSVLFTNFLSRSCISCLKRLCSKWRYSHSSMICTSSNSRMEFAKGFIYPKKKPRTRKLLHRIFFSCILLSFSPFSADESYLRGTHSVFSITSYSSLRILYSSCVFNAPFSILAWNAAYIWLR